MSLSQSPVRFVAASCLAISCVWLTAPIGHAQDADALKKQQEDARKQIEQLQREQAEKLKKIQKEAEDAASHKLHKSVAIEAGKGISLQTLTVTADGRVLALVAPPRTFGAPVKDAASEVRVLDAEGDTKSIWKVAFHATAVNEGPDGTVYVAGDGKLARFDKAGKPIGEVIELPYVTDAIKNPGKLKEKAEAQVKMQKDSFLKSVQQYKDRIAKLKEKPEAERTKTDLAMLKSADQILASYAETEKYFANMTVDSVLAGMLGRVRIISSVAASEKDLFVVCGETEGFGFAVWRTTPDLKDAKKILTNISGCCGQMDVQCCGADIVVAENTRHRFAKYDRDGKEVAVGGKRGKETEPGCFGGCCNPMNVRGFGGDILTAESEGLIKKFSSTGEFIGIVGGVPISGGCKNVAVAVNADASRVYFCDQPGGKVMILARKPGSK
jgi:hypothetical protein